MKASIGMVIFIGGSICSLAQNESTVRLEQIVSSGLERPVFLTHAPGNDNQLFIVEAHTGDILIYDLSTNSLLNDPFFTVTDLSGQGSGSEQGLLGLAFHPNYASNGRFFTYSTGLSNETRVQEHKLGSPDKLLLTFPQPVRNHNGGWIGFGPNDYLHISSGDGGGGNDPFQAGQSIEDNLQTSDVNEAFLGKILRIDVDGDDAYPNDDDRNYAIPASNPFVGRVGADEIWLYGLRHPWRCSFDAQLGDFWIGDVGQNLREEVDFFPAKPEANQNRNFGWRLREGTGAPTVGGPRPVDNVDPVFEYDHGSDGGISVISGYVYRGVSMPWLQGTYFCADYASANMWSFRYDSELEEISDFRRQSKPSSLIEVDAGVLGRISAFGEGPDREIYICCLPTTVRGEVFPARIYKIRTSYDLWQRDQFTGEELNDPEISGPDADPDRDGKPNLAEFVAGQDPRRGDEGLPMNLAIEDSEGDDFAFFEFKASPQGSQVSVVAEENIGLRSNDWILSEIVEANPQTGEYIFKSNKSISTNERLFMRLRFTQPDAE